MKKLMLSTALLAMTGIAVNAQDVNATFRAAADPMELHASQLIGKRVYSSEANIEGDAFNGVQDNWEDIGEINDIVLSRDGQVDAVLVDIGGFLGIGERQVAVDMKALRLVADDATPEDESDYFLVVNAPRAALEQAPEYSWNHDAAMTDAAATGDTAADATATDTTEATATDNAAATDATAPAPMTREGYVPAEPADLTAEMLTGAPVYDAEDKDVGEVSQINLSDDGKVSAVVVDVGGFLGMGEKPVELQLGDINILRAEDGGDIRVYVSKTKEELEAMPTYEK